MNITKEQFATLANAEPTTLKLWAISNAEGISADELKPKVVAKYGMCGATLNKYRKAAAALEVNEVLTIVEEVVQPTVVEQQDPDTIPLEPKVVQNIVHISNTPSPTTSAADFDQLLTFVRITNPNYAPTSYTPAQLADAKAWWERHILKIRADVITYPTAADAADAICALLFKHMEYISLLTAARVNWCAAIVDSAKRVTQFTVRYNTDIVGLSKLPYWEEA